MAIPPWLRLSVRAAAIVLPNRYWIGMPRTTRGLLRRLKLSGNKCGASDGRMCWTALYSLTYPATPSAASSRTSSALAIVPLKIRIGSRPSSSLRMARTRSTPGACGRRRSRTIRSTWSTSARTRASSSAALVTVDGLVSRALERGAKAIADERRIVGDDDRLRGDRGTGHLDIYRSAVIRAVGRVADLRTLSI